MYTKSALSCADVETILQAAKAEALANQWAVTIAVADDGGHLLGMLRLDGAPPMSAHIGPSKAKTAAVARRETKILEDIINNGRTAFVTAPYVDGLLEGGVPVLVNGQVVGAVGVSGVKSDQDAQIAKAGIAALGL
ncbi:MAG: heme-binding protein [Limnobacter sp.]|mgnify:CR=1 FL=1|jgi:glc operon protein GlcG|nr:heme-binding protein [Limnobacter sp.]